MMRADHSLAFYKQILNSAPADVVVFDAGKKYLYINPAAIKDPALREWLIGRTDFDYCRIKQRSISLAENRHALFDSVIHDKEQKEWEEEWVNDDGSIAYHLRKVYPLFNGNGSLQMMIMCGLDITERVRTENKLRESEELYRVLVQEASDYGIFMLDPEGEITTWNEGACRIHGYTSGEIIGKQFSGFYPDNEWHSGNYGNELAIALKEGKYEEEGWMVKKDGTLFWVNAIIAPLYNFENKLIGFSGIVRDLTERRKAEELLHEAREKAEISSRAKQLFLANMSHEIRTPMNAITGMSKLLLQDKLTVKQRSFIDAIVLSANNLLMIIDDILDFSKMDAGRLSVHLAGFNPVQLLRQLAQMLEFRMETEEVSLTLEPDTRLHHVLISDPVRITQVMLNLAGNALKFTEKGTVDISVKVLEDKDDAQILEFLVKDTGIGIAQDQLPNIFDVFYQVDEPGMARFRGTGLGLSITRQLVELLGGKVFVESIKHKGTSIGFIIELKKGTVDDLPVKHEIILHNDLLRNKHILLVEDNEINRLLVMAVLEKWGIKTDQAENGLQALKKLNSNSYDLVIMDVRMPEMNGLEATRHIREKLRSDIPVIAMTADVIKGDAEECIRAGMNDYVPKPFEENDLFLKICRQLKVDTQHIGYEAAVQVVDEEALYSTAKLEKASKGDRAFVKRMLALFIEHITETMEQLNSACATNDYEKIRDIAHKAGPSILNVCNASIGSLIHAIESEAAMGTVSEKRVKTFNQQMKVILEQIKERELTDS